MAKSVSQPHIQLTQRPLTPGLYIVPTPIGNLADITLRALEVLAGVARIACEDTRVTGKLLKHYSIATPMIAYHEHNAAERLPDLVRRIKAGEAIALVSDAGTPLISDPGYRLVAELVAREINVVPLPGATSVTTALSASGLPSDTFTFAGFLPQKKAQRKKRLAEFVGHPATLIFFESPRRLAASLADCAEILGGDRDAMIARELTKLYETLYRGSLSSLAVDFGQDEPPKGEIVIVIAPGEPVPPDDDDIEQRLKQLIETHRVKEAADIAARETGLSKRDLYQRALKLKSMGVGQDD
ncbi:MAG: 16S rRNA (cytidine(1402)-2'-O)-methyltransferase [Pseudomonadota bacterium]